MKSAALKNFKFSSKYSLFLELPPGTTHDGCVGAESGMPPPELVLGHLFAYQLSVQEVPHDAPSEALGDLLQIAERDVAE